MEAYVDIITEPGIDTLSIAIAKYCQIGNYLQLLCRIKHWEVLEKLTEVGEVGLQKCLEKIVGYRIFQ